MRGKPIGNTMGVNTWAGTFVFGSGLAIVPFLHGGIVLLFSLKKVPEPLLILAAGIVGFFLKTMDM